MFRRLCWTVGILFAFIGGIVLVGGTIGETMPRGVTSGAPGKVLWLIAVAVCFGVGFLLMRVTGWLILGILPHGRHHHPPPHFPEEAHDRHPGTRPVPEPALQDEPGLPDGVGMVWPRERSDCADNRPRTKIGRGVRGTTGPVSDEKGRFRRGSG